MASSAVMRRSICRNLARRVVTRSSDSATTLTASAGAVTPCHQFSLVNSSRYLSTSVARFSFEKLPETDREEVRRRTVDVVKNFHRNEPEKVTDEAKFIDDLGLDSLDAVEIVMALEDEFDIEISDEEAEKVANIRTALDVVAEKVAAK